MAVVPKYTPNKPKDAGLEASQKLGWWHAYRFFDFTQNQPTQHHFDVFKRTDVECLDLKR